MLHAADDVTAKFDCVFWMGDLNCRLERDRPYLESLINGLESAEKHSKIGIVDYGPLVALDELTRVMGQGKVNIANSQILRIISQ